MNANEGFASRLRQRLRFGDEEPVAKWRNALATLNCAPVRDYPDLDFLELPDASCEYTLVFVVTREGDMLTLNLARRQTATGRITALEGYYVQNSQAMDGSFSANDCQLLQQLYNYISESEGRFLISIWDCGATLLLSTLASQERLYIFNADKTISMRISLGSECPTLRFEFASSPGGWILRTTRAPQGDFFVCGCVIDNGIIFFISNPDSAPLAAYLARMSTLTIPAEDLQSFVTAMTSIFSLHKFLDTPFILDCKKGDFTPVLYLKADVCGVLRKPFVNALIAFRYGDQERPSLNRMPPPSNMVDGHTLFLRCENQGTSEIPHLIVFERNLDAEKIEIDTFREFDGTSYSAVNQSYRILSSKILDVTYEILRRGWTLWAEKLEVKVWSEFKIHVATSNDWFDLTLESPKLKSNLSMWQIFIMLKRKGLFVRLSDGSIGVLPEVWYKKLCAFYDTVKAGAEDAGVSLAHALAIDELNPASFDEKFAIIRDRLKDINGIEPKSAGEDFSVNLRPYQEIGLGWLSFLYEFGLGGVLADDMGLGKTVQVLALLDGLRGSEAPRPGSLIVGPKTLLHVWTNEARRLAPKLRCHVLQRSDLANLEQVVANYDLVLVSFNFLRSQVDHFSTINFDVIVCDEAQFIKNSGTRLSRAMCRLNGQCKLALSGTPIENRIQDLFALFDFVNPKFVSESVRHLNPDSELDRPKIEACFRQMRPYILRRTKAEVLSELPEKTETIISLLMTATQRDVYGKVHSYFVERLRDQKMKHGSVALNNDFLEGILRLRQAACDPGILEAQPKDPLPSNKIRFVLLKAAELVAMRRKAVVFSQFTSFLKLICLEFDRAGVAYEYLDGKTQDRQGTIESFRSDSNVCFLLASTRVGGTGINLTEAEYCFILDPWWNPAVERQAIDRIHRIGQKKTTTVYRLISEGSIEEKMLQLQERKLSASELLDASDEEFLRGLTVEDFGLNI